MTKKPGMSYPLARILALKWSVLLMQNLPFFNSVPIDEYWDWLEEFCLNTYRRNVYNCKGKPGSTMSFIFSRYTVS